jgi:hypothetical protein
MYGLFISTILRNPGAAVAVGITTLVLIDFIKGLVGLDPYIVTKYVGYSWANLQLLAQGMDFKWFPEVGKMMMLSGMTALTAFGAGLIVFVREDLNR